MGWESKESWKCTEECRRGGVWGRGGVALFSCGYIWSGEGSGRGGVGGASDRVERGANKHSLRSGGCGMRSRGGGAVYAGDRLTGSCMWFADAGNKQANKQTTKKKHKEASIMHAYTHACILRFEGRTCALYHYIYRPLRQKKTKKRKTRRMFPSFRLL